MKYFLWIITGDYVVYDSKIIKVTIIFQIINMGIEFYEVMTFLIIELIVYRFDHYTWGKILIKLIGYF